MILRDGSQGLPCGSQEAALYKIRLFAGHEKDQLEKAPVLSGSVLSRRAMLLPSSFQQPE